MKKYIRFRLWICVPVLLGITIFNFVIVYMAPGDPADMLIRPGLLPDMIEAKKELMGFNKPILIQYGIWLKNILCGNWGYSYSTHRPVLSMIVQRLGATFLLMGSGMILSLVIAFPLGIVSGLKRNQLIDRVLTVCSFVFCSIPGFFLGICLIYIFSLKLSLLPSSGMATLGIDRNLRDILWHMILPVSVLALPAIGSYTRYIRGCVADVLSQDYIRTAIAKGAPFGRIIGVHMLKSTLITIVTLIGTEIPSLFCGAVIVEQIFGWPGIGNLTMDSILARDYPVLLGVNLIAAIIILITNLTVDVIYCFINPQIRYG